MKKEARNRNCVLVLIFIVFLCNAAFYFNKKKELQRANISPVIFIPGDGGSQMEAKLNKSTSAYHICQKTADWYSIWLNLEQLVIPAIYCWVENFKLYYNSTTRTTQNTPGVQTRTVDWGNPEVVEWIDPTHNKAGAYFKDIGNMLVELGYERKKNILGAPYDFRKAPNELQQWFIDFKQLIEDAYESNEQTSVTLISHSMGSPLTLVFLQRQSMEWREKYVRRLISLAGAWAGSVKALKVFAIGDNLDSWLLFPTILKAGQASAPSTAFLLPSPLFWNSSEILVEAPSRVYMMSQMESFFRDIDNPVGWEMRKDTMRYTINFSPPEVELHCLYGNGLETVERLHYKKAVTADVKPDLIMGRGDGTVNERSLRACHVWAGSQKGNITNVELSGVDHMGILASADVLTYIKSVLKP